MRYTPYWASSWFYGDNNDEAGGGKPPSPSPYPGWPLPPASSWPPMLSQGLWPAIKSLVSTTPLGAWWPMIRAGMDAYSTLSATGRPGATAGGATTSATGGGWPRPPFGGFAQGSPSPDTERKLLVQEGVLPTASEKRASPSPPPPAPSPTSWSSATGTTVGQLSPEDQAWYDRFTQEHGGITPEQYGYGTPEENLRQNLQDRALQEAYVLAHGPDYMKMQALANRASWLMPSDRWQTALYLRRSLGREPTVAEIDAAWSRANGVSAPSGIGAGGYFTNIVPWIGPYTFWLRQP